MNAKQIFEKLVQTAYSYSWRLSSSMSARRHQNTGGPPGALVAKLSPEEREELMNLTSKDTDAARHHLNYMIGSYPENTVTIHTHTIKKDDDDSEQ